MRKLMRRLLGIQPGPAALYGEALVRVGRDVAAGFAEGLRDPRPLTPGEMAHLLDHCEGVAHRSFSALYDDEEPTR